MDEKLVLQFSLIGYGFLGFFVVALDRWLGKSREALVFSVCLGSISSRFIYLQGIKYWLLSNDCVGFVV